MRSDVLRISAERILRNQGIARPLARAVLRTVAAERLSGYQHPLGFLHLEIPETFTFPHRIRLHVWSDSWARGADELGKCHDHTWDLYSGVLVGQLTDISLQAQELPDGQHNAFRIIYDPAGNALIAIPGRWDLVEVCRREVMAGEQYSMPAGTIHTTDVNVFPTATLVVVVERGGVGPRVYTTGSTPTALQAAVRTPVGKDRVSDALEGAIANLS